MTNDLTIRAAFGQLPGDEVRKLALTAIGALSRGKLDESSPPEQEISELLSVFLSLDALERRRAVDRLRAEGLPASRIIDRIIPEIAQRLGQEWAEDRISFVDVTIAAARMQETVRMLGTSNRAYAPGRQHALRPKDRHAITGYLPKILLIVPRGEHHTLGAFIAADQFRRFGYSVEIGLDLTTKQVADLVRQTPFAMIGITVSGRRTLALSKELVETIRTVVVRRTPIVIGGSVPERDTDLRDLTGADYVATSARSALEQSGLGIWEPNAPQRVVSDHVD